MMAGRSWDGIEMTHVVFQVLWADGQTLLIDSAQDREMHEATPGSGPFDVEAWERVVAAMEAASQIVITHEHPDHLGGVARHPRPEALVPKLRLTLEQFENVEALEEIDFPTTIREGVTPLVYEDAVAIAPGVVLKKAPGHTPGSQMVFVALADGRELIFVGDVVWNLDAITDLVYRPRLMTDLLIGENREFAIHQLRALRDLYDQGEVSIVVSHDRRTHEAAAISSGFNAPLP
jgi:glyoxylase-like metal-dependent hydrolase (beta-lactamase superfamily II)